MKSLAKQNRKPFSIVPTTLDEALKFAEKIAQSSLCPNAYKGKAGDVLVAMQMGAEVGLSPMQSIQNISVINGRPSIWGDAMLAVVRVHPECEGVREWLKGSIKEGNSTAYCGIKREGQEEEIRKFSITDAMQAGLWEKAGPWKQYPERMLQMRARGFCARDVFPDALRGLYLVEEAQDIPEEKYIEVKSDKSKGVEGLKEKLGLVEAPIIDIDAEIVNEDTGEVSEAVNTTDIDTVRFLIECASTVKQLIDAGEQAKLLPEEDRKTMRVLYKEKEKQLNS